MPPIHRRNSYRRSLNQPQNQQTEKQVRPGYSWLENLTLAEQSFRIYFKAYRKGRKVSIRCYTHAIDKRGISIKNKASSAYNPAGKACQTRHHFLY